MLEFHGATYVHERFEALAARHCHPGGSAGTVGVAMNEMLALGLKPRPAFYGAALAVSGPNRSDPATRTQLLAEHGADSFQVLAIHPNHIFRTMLLHHMRKDWIETTPEHRIHTVLGLLRDGQYEMALDEVDDMLARGISVPAYLHEVLIFAFANLGFIDEAMAHLNHRMQQDPPPRDDIFYFLLDTCAAAQHYTSTAHLWRAAGPKITPSDGTLLNILNTAARHADPPLALEALRRLSDRKVQMSFHHFEPVVEAYALAGDLEGAFRMLCVMDGAGVRPRRDATREVFSALRKRPGDIASCVAILERLRETYRVPVAAVNVLLEAAVEADDVPTAVDILDRMESLTPDPPTQTTLLPFLSLPIPPLPICAKAITLFPHSLNLPPADLARLATYLAPHDVDAALAYLRRVDAVYEGEADAWEVHTEAVRTVTLELLREEDERAWELLMEAARRTPAVAEEVRELVSTGEL